MTELQEQELDQVLDTVQPEELKDLHIVDHVSAAKEVYRVIRPALVGIGWIIRFLAPKLFKASQTLITVLDGLFEVLPVALSPVHTLDDDPPPPDAPSDPTKPRDP